MSAKVTEQTGLSQDHTHIGTTKFLLCLTEDHVEVKPCRGGFLCNSSFVCEKKRQPSPNKQVKRGIETDCHQLK